MIAFARIAGSWTIGPAGGVRCDMTVEPIRADARSGSEADGLAITLPGSVRQYFDPPPIGETIAVIDTAGGSIVEGVIDSVSIAFGGEIRLSIDL